VPRFRSVLAVTEQVLFRIRLNALNILFRPLRSLWLPSLRVPFGALLPAAPLGVPNAVAFAPLGYAARFRLGSNAHAFLPIQKLTTHYATCFIIPLHAVPIILGSEKQIYQARNCIGSSIEIPIFIGKFLWADTRRVAEVTEIFQIFCNALYWTKASKDL
jgi:hypothetical protein